MPCILDRSCALFTGCLTLVLMSVSAYNIHHSASPFVITAGAILGLCAGLLWTAQGSLMLAYPTESEKGRFIGIFWSIFNLGAVVGASVALGNSWKSSVRIFRNLAFLFFHLPSHRPVRVSLNLSKYIKLSF